MTYRQICRLWDRRWCWVPLAVAVGLVVGCLAWHQARAEMKIPPAYDNTDQSFLLSVGYQENGSDGATIAAQYKHPFSDNVQWYLSVNRSIINDKVDRTEGLIGLQIYPFLNRIYFQMGLGATKAGSDSDGIFSGAVGYEHDLSEFWFLDIHGGLDWNIEGEQRSAVFLGVGKRF